MYAMLCRLQHGIRRKQCTTMSALNALTKKLVLQVEKHCCGYKPLPSAKVKASV